jgi:hypothetical protein
MSRAGASPAPTFLGIGMRLTERDLHSDAVDEAIDGYEKKALPQGWLLIRKIEASIGPVLAKKFLTSAWRRPCLRLKIAIVRTISNSSAAHAHSFNS